MLGTPIATEVVSLAQLLAGYDRLTAYADRNGIPIHPSSRIPLYGKTLDLQRRSGGVGSDDPHTAAFELRHLVTIVDGLGALPSFAPAFRSLLKGQPSSLFAPTQDPGRDKQFELFVAATLALRGLRVALEEPDVHVDVGGVGIGIAAKRPRTALAMESAIREGRHQIRKSGIPGMVAVDTSLFPIPNGRLLVGMLDRPEDVQRATTGQLVEVVKRAGQLVASALRGEPQRTGTVGLLFYMAVPFVVDVESKLQLLVGAAWSAVLPTRDLSGPAGRLISAMVGPRRIPDGETDKGESRPL